MPGKQSRQREYVFPILINSFLVLKNKSININVFPHQLTGLYKGMSSPLLGVSFINAMAFLSYGTAQRTLNSMQGRKENATLNLRDIFFCGMGTGAAVALVECPFDLFKAKLQVQYAGKNFSK